MSHVLMIYSTMDILQTIASVTAVFCSTELLRWQLKQAVFVIN